MPATRLTMRNIREVLRLACECRLTRRQIATSCSIARSTVSEYLMRFAVSGLGWPLSAQVDDAKLESLLHLIAASCGEFDPQRFKRHRKSTGNI